MDEKLLDFIAGFSNYTCKALEDNCDSKKTRDQLIQEIISNKNINISKERMEQMNDVQISYLKVICDSLDILMNERKFLN